MQISGFIIKLSKNIYNFFSMKLNQKINVMFTKSELKRILFLFIWMLLMEQSEEFNKMSKNS